MSSTRLPCLVFSIVDLITVKPKRAGSVYCSQWMTAGTGISHFGCQYTRLYSVQATHYWIWVIWGDMNKTGVSAIRLH